MSNYRREPFLQAAYGNPSTLYSLARDSRKAVAHSREVIAAAIHADPSEIFFTSGGKEADNWALKGTAFQHERGKSIITSAIEHHAILNNCAALERKLLKPKSEVCMAKNQRDFFKRKNEWSKIKDTLLRCYLPQYFQKLLVSGKPIFYVDCFAGKGKFDDGNDGSPLIAMQIINERIGMSRISKKNNAILPCFIELNHAADLKQNLKLQPYKYGTPQVVDGKFEDNIRQLLKDKCGYNIFLYIDPYGIQALDSQLFDEIDAYGFRSFEMLINFNSFGFFRDACRVMRVDISRDDALMGLDDLVEYEPTMVTSSLQSENLLTRIAGGNYWVDIVKDFQAGRIDGYKAERRLSAEYKQHLKKKYKYVLDMPIRLKPDQRPKYRMIHVCDHEDGCFLMAENMQRRKDELFVNIQQNGQLSLFNMMSAVTSTVENDILTQDEIEQMVLNHIRHMTGETHITVFLADFCNEYGVICPFKMIYEILIKLEESGTIDIVRDPALTSTGKKRTFWEEKSSQTVIVRRRT